MCQDEAGCCLWTEIMVLTSMAPPWTHDIRAKPSTLGQSTGWPCTEHCLWPPRCSCQESAGSSLSSLSNCLFKGRVPALLSWLLQLPLKRFLGLNMLAGLMLTTCLPEMHLRAVLLPLLQLWWLLCGWLGLCTVHHQRSWFLGWAHKQRRRCATPLEFWGSRVGREHCQHRWHAQQMVLMLSTRAAAGA